MTHTTIPSSAVDAGNAPQQPYGGMNQMGSGPAALLYTLANQLMSLYNEIEAMCAEITKSETQLQSTMIMTGNQTQRAAAHLQAVGIGCQAVGDLASAAGSIYTIKAEGSQNTDNMKMLDAQQAKLNKLNSLEAITRAPTGGDKIMSNAAGPAKDELAIMRAKNLLNNPFYEEKDYNGNQAALDKDNRAAYDQMSQAKDNNMQVTFRQNLQNRIDGLVKEINTTQNRISVTQNHIQQRSQAISSGLKIAGDAGNAICTAYAGNYQASKSVADGVNQVAQSTGETTRQNLGKFYDMCASLIAAARQGAQAYAQT